MSDSLTFRNLEHAAGVEIENEPSSSLELWYSSVRDKPLNDLSEEDLCKACRQTLYLDSVVPVSLARLATNPLAGEMYDGELLAAVASVPPELWANNASLKEQLRKLIQSLDIETDDADVNYAINILSAAIQTNDSKN